MVQTANGAPMGLRTISVEIRRPSGKAPLEVDIPGRCLDNVLRTIYNESNTLRMKLCVHDGAFHHTKSS